MNLGKPIPGILYDPSNEMTSGACHRRLYGRTNSDFCRVLFAAMSDALHDTLNVTTSDVIGAELIGKVHLGSFHADLGVVCYLMALETFEEM